MRQYNNQIKKEKLNMSEEDLQLFQYNNQSWPRYMPSRRDSFNSTFDQMQQDPFYLEQSSLVQSMISENHTKANTFDHSTQQQGNLVLETQNSQKNLNQPIVKLKQPKRSGNSVISNCVRELQKTIELILQRNLSRTQQALKQYLSFKQQNQIKSKIWAIDALCIKIFHLRDQNKLITEDDCKSILETFSFKLKRKLDKKPNQYSIKKIKCYQLHIQEYSKSQFSFSNFDILSTNQEILFGGLVKKRNNQIRKCLNELEKIYKQLDKNKSLFKQEFYQESSKKLNKKTSRKRNFSKKIKN